MGSKPTIPLPPFEITRGDAHSYVPKTTVGPVYTYIHSHVVLWYRSGRKFDLPVFNKEGISPNALDQIAVRNNSYRCRVKHVIQLDNNTVLLRLKIKRKADS